MDISKQLHAYEVEYHVLQDETVDAVLQSNNSDRLDKLEKTNNQLKKQNMDLLEKLQVGNWLNLIQTLLFPQGNSFCFPGVHKTQYSPKSHLTPDSILLFTL